MAPFLACALSGVFFSTLLVLGGAAPKEFDEEIAFINSLKEDLSVNDLLFASNEEVLPHRAYPFASTPNLIGKYGYPSETHIVQTVDGYLLRLHRIPNPGKPPVFIQHGILSSSADWVVLGPKKALAFILYDAGYDVWMGNSRGSTYSRAHVSMDLLQGKFWDFSWHEIGLYDLPASIDTVLEKTGKKDLVYIGHSQGTTAFFVMASLRPEYNEKIRVMFAMAPVAYLNELRSFPLRVISAATSQIGFIANIIGMHEFLPSTKFIRKMASYLCAKQPITQPLCMNVLFLICGFDSEQLNKTMLPEIFANVPAGSSTKQLVHYGQLVKREPVFRQFDYGWVRNLMYYGTFTPPSYDLSKITTQVHLHYGENDLLAVPEGVSMLYKALPNAVEYSRVPHDYFNHLDFLFAKDARDLLYDRVINKMKEMYPPMGTAPLPALQTNRTGGLQLESGSVILRESYFTVNRKVSEPKDVILCIKLNCKVFRCKSFLLIL